MRVVVVKNSGQQLRFAGKPSLVLVVRLYIIIRVADVVYSGNLRGYWLARDLRLVRLLVLTEKSQSLIDEDFE